ALARRAIDLDACAVTLHGAVDHRKAKPGAAFALGGEEGLEATAARVVVHTDTAVHHFEYDAVVERRVAPFRSAELRRAGAYGERAVVLHGIHCIEDEIDERFAQLAFDAEHLREIRFQLGTHRDGDAAELGHVAPACS